MKMKIINWHLFSNETIEIKNNVVITGENGTGKSTLLDALQYILTAGKAKFNSAANDSGKRNIEGYIRGKLGREGKPYLRTGDVVSYIVLEYFDETSKRTQLLGVVIELTQSNLKKELFFQVLDQKIQDDLFMKNNHIFNRNEFKKNLSYRKIKANFADKKSLVPGLFRQSLGVSKKYFELIPRALAFKPINQVYNFIYDFLLVEDYVKIDDLRNNIRAYRNLNDVLKEQQKRLESLETIEKFYTDYQKENHKLKNHEYVKDILYLEGLNYQKNEYEKAIQKSQLLIKDYQQKVDLAKEKNENLQKEVLRLENTLENNEGYRLKKELENQLEFQQKLFQQSSNRFHEYIHHLNSEIKILKQLRIKNAFVLQIESHHYDSTYLSDYLFDIKNDLYEKRNQLSQNNTLLHNEIHSLKVKQDELKKQSDLLERNRFYYRQEVQKLIDILKEQLNQYYQKKIDVKPLCEYLEVTDESWRNAIEGYLHTQRFDIIIEPEYFVKAMQIYEQYKKDHLIFGVGIVNVLSLNQYSHTSEGSLAQYVTSYNSYAKHYANMLLNRVMCVETVEDLTKYKTAITRTCMVYNHNAVRAINPKVYQKPFLGLEAIKIQKSLIHQQLQDLTQELDIKNKQYQESGKQIKIIDQSKIDYLIGSNQVIDEYHHLNNDIQQLKSRLKEIKQDDSVITMITQLDVLKNKYKESQIDYSEKQNHLAKENANFTQNQQAIEKIENELKNLPDLSEMIIDEAVEKIKQRYYKKYNHQYQTMQNQLFLRIRELQNQVDKNCQNVEYAMKAFNHESQMGYEESIKNIDNYLNLYYQLRDIEIIKRQEDVRNARMKCEMSFQESFISRLNEKINQAKKDIRELNDGLKNKNFNGDRYEFEVNPSKRKEYRKYYDIISSNQQYNSDNLFVTTLSKENRSIMDELFQQISLLDDNESGEKLLQKYTDYREYLDYDIKILHENGDFTKFSKVNREKSGGETQTPFYVVIASSFEQLIKSRKSEDSGCVVLFDEAFNNMDETRIQSMMKFYNELNVQIILAAPPDRASTIMPYVDTTLAIIKSGDHSFVEEIIHE